MRNFHPPLNRSDAGEGSWPVVLARRSFSGQEYLWKTSSSFTGHPQWDLAPLPPPRGFLSLFPCFIYKRREVTAVLVRFMGEGSWDAALPISSHSPVMVLEFRPCWLHCRHHCSVEDSTGFSSRPQSFAPAQPGGINQGLLPGHKLFPGAGTGSVEVTPMLGGWFQAAGSSTSCCLQRRRKNHPHVGKLTVASGNNGQERETAGPSMVLAGFTPSKA